MNISKNNFNNKCYNIVLRIPKGKVSTYKEIAKALNTRAYRAVGNAMSKNPNLISTPCHRVVRSNASIGQYVLGVTKKINLLLNEGVFIKKGKVVNFKDIIHKF